MQIREQGRQVQLIRSPYDSVKKRCVQKVVHTFHRAGNYISVDINDYLTAEQSSDLSADENKTLSDWLKAKADKSLSDVRKYSIMLASNDIGRLTDAILADGVSEEKALEIWCEIDKLSKALKKAGFPKSSLKAPAIKTGLTDQASLL